MARIRTLKPDHGIHRKVGPLSDRTYRVWVAGLVTQADDEGRLPWSPDEIRAKAFSYHPRVKARDVVSALEELARAGLLLVYDHTGRRYIQLHDWDDHQSVRKTSHFSPSKHPSSTRSVVIPPPFREQLEIPAESSVTTPPSRAGVSEGKEGKEGSSNPSPRDGEVTESSSFNGWGSPEALVALYNELTPDECPAVKELTPGRVKKAKAYLAIFPLEDFWRRVFAEIHRSQFLRGHKPSPGHEHFVAGFDWLLSKGKDQSENVAKVSEGKYRDKGA